MVLAIKFPGRLAGLCSEFSANATSEAQPYSLAEAVVKSTLPKGDRIRVLTEFAQRGSLEHKRCVLQNLAELDQQRCAEVLVPILDNFPADSSGKYWTCPEAAFTHVVMQIEDDATWRRYLRVAKRSSIGLRMEIMNPLCYDYIGAKNRERRLAFAAAFLDDKALRDTSSNADKFDGPSAAFTFPKITVRDFAALKVASILRLGDCPDEFWTDAQWTALREKVGQRLAAEKLPDLGSDKGR